MKNSLPVRLTPGGYDAALPERGSPGRRRGSRRRGSIGDHSPHSIAVQWRADPAVIIASRAKARWGAPALVPALVIVLPTVWPVVGAPAITVLPVRALRLPCPVVIGSPPIGPSAPSIVAPSIVAPSVVAPSIVAPSIVAVGEAVVVSRRLPRLWRSRGLPTVRPTVLTPDCHSAPSDRGFRQFHPWCIDPALCHRYDFARLWCPFRPHGSSQDTDTQQ